MKKTMQWGNGKNADYDLILDYYSKTSVNSIKTSSIPLAELWKNSESEIDQIADKIGKKLDDIHIYFEYPTPSLGKNKSSMSDIMIITEDYKIAIEGKYTEYDYNEYEKIDLWLKKGDNSKNRKNVLNHWLEILKPYSNIQMQGLEKIPYQFLHRTASACYRNEKNAIVLYQIFYDTNSLNIDQFIDELKNAVLLIRPNDRLKFIFEKIEVASFRQVELNEVFQVMKKESIYKFGKRSLEMF